MIRAHFVRAMCVLPFAGLVTSWSRERTWGPPTLEVAEAMKRIRNSGSLTAEQLKEALAEIYQFAPRANPAPCHEVHDIDVFGRAFAPPPHDCRWVYRYCDPVTEWGRDDRTFCLCGYTEFRVT